MRVDAIILSADSALEFLSQVWERRYFVGPNGVRLRENDAIRVIFVLTDGESSRLLIRRSLHNLYKCRLPSCVLRSQDLVQMMIDCHLALRNGKVNHMTLPLVEESKMQPPYSAET